MLMVTRENLQFPEVEGRVAKHSLLHVKLLDLAMMSVVCGIFMKCGA